MAIKLDTALQSQKAVSAHLSVSRYCLFGFVRQDTELNVPIRYNYCIVCQVIKHVGDKMYFNYFSDPTIFPTA